MNNNTDCETVYIIHKPHGVVRETYPTVDVGEEYPLFPVPYPGKNCTLMLYSLGNFTEDEVDPFNLCVDRDENGYIMQLTALDVVNYNPISNECLVDGEEPHCIYFGHTEVNIDDVIIVDDQDNVLGKLDEKIPLNKIPFSIKLKSKNGDIVRLKTHIIKF